MDGSPQKMTFHFSGPFFFSASDGPPIHSAPDIDGAGVYLFAYRTASGETLVEYVGESGLFRQRIAEHLRGMFSLEYRVLNTDALADGRAVHEWDGFFRLCKDASRDLFSLAVDRYPMLHASLLNQVRATRIFLATVEGPRAFRECVEGAIGRHLRQNPAGRLIAPDLRFRREQTDIAIALTVSSSEPMAGFPAHFGLPRDA